MRRNRAATKESKLNSSIAFQPSTPLLLNQNSNSCSNDTICSSFSINNNSTPQNTTTTIIAQDELKIRNLLKELQTNVKHCQQERDASEPNISAILKTHEKIKKEEKVTPFYRKKLQTLYQTNIKLSENEIKRLREALDCINQVRLTQNEIRLLQQQNNSSSSLVSSPLNSFNDNTLTDKSNKKSSTVTMRRGVLMSILQQAALTLPLWVGEIGENAPPLTGSNPPESNYSCKVGDKVAALVKNSNNNTKMQADLAEQEEEEDEEENWILAEVVAYNSHSGKYDVEDVDTEEGQERYTLSKKCVVPLPLWRANPITDECCIFKVGSIVLALYPQTTCFYRGLVNETPNTPQDDYLILFEDNTYPEGYSPPLQVPQLYVVAYHDLKK